MADEPDDGGEDDDDDEEEYSLYCNLLLAGAAGDGCSGGGGGGVLHSLTESTVSGLCVSTPVAGNNGHEDIELRAVETCTYLCRVMQHIP